MYKTPDGGIRTPHPYTGRKMGFGAKKQAERIGLADVHREAPHPSASAL